MKFGGAIRDIQPYTPHLYIEYILWINGLQSNIVYDIKLLLKKSRYFVLILFATIFVLYHIILPPVGISKRKRIQWVIQFINMYTNICYIVQCNAEGGGGSNG